MKIAFLLMILCPWAFFSQAQPVRYASDVEPLIKNINNSISIKHYQGSLSEKERYSYTLISDSVTNKLLKAVVRDDRSKSTRTYYFHNDYLIKVTEKFDQPSPVTFTSHFFLEFDYALAIDFKDDSQKEVLERQRLQSDAYRLLLHFRKMSSPGEPHLDESTKQVKS